MTFHWVEELYITNNFGVALLALRAGEEVQKGLGV